MHGRRRAEGVGPIACMSWTRTGLSGLKFRAMGNRAWHAAPGMNVLDFPLGRTSSCRNALVEAAWDLGSKRSGVAIRRGVGGLPDRGSAQRTAIDRLHCQTV